MGHLAEGSAQMNAILGVTEDIEHVQGDAVSIELKQAFYDVAI